MSERDVQPDDERGLVAIRHEPIDGTVTVLSFRKRVSDVFRGRPWAANVRDVGWTFPARYLEHVEKLLDGAGVDLFDVDGVPTPARRAELAALERAASDEVVGEIRAKREWCEAHSAQIEHARRAARAAFGEALRSTVGSEPTAEETVG